MGFLGDFGVGAKIFGGNTLRNATTTDQRRVIKKLWRYCKYPSLYTRQRNYKKTECLRRDGLHFTPVQRLPP